MQRPLFDLDHWNTRWLGPIRQALAIEMASADSGHGLEHVERVVKNAIRIAETLTVDYEVLLPATWFHDCVCVAKNSPLRSQASRLAAKRALGMLEDLGYPTDQCQSVEAQVLQDADRLEALGAIGLARCLMTGGAMGQRLYHPDDPFPTTRELRDDQQSIDHFFAKLLKLPSTMQTTAGREIAQKRAGFLVDFLIQLSLEIDKPFSIPRNY